MTTLQVITLDKERFIHGIALFFLFIRWLRQKVLHTQLACMQREHLPFRRAAVSYVAHAAEHAHCAAAALIRARKL